MNPEEKSKIEELKKSLYSRNTPNIRTKRRLRFDTEETNIKTDWEHEPEVVEEAALNERYKDNSMSFFTKLLIVSIIFFVIALGVGAYFVLNKSNLVSANNIDIVIDGPVSIAGGDPLTFDIQVQNKNNIKLETVDLTVDFPAGTVDATDTTKELKKIRELIDDIEPGGTGNKSIEAVVYGEENSKKEIKITVEYRVKGSNAIFQKQKTFEVLISSSPLTISLSSFKEVNAGQEFEISILLTSNSKEPIKNLLLKAIYPFGFTFISSSMKTLSDTTVWKIGDVPPGGKKIVKIKGKLDGQDDEVRVFKFIAGAQSVRNEKAIGTEYISGMQEISIKKPFVNIGISLDGDDENQEYVGSFNNPIKVEVSYFNNLPTAIIDGEISVKLSGSAFEKSSISPEQGVYDSAKGEIVWNEKTTRQLGDIAGGDSGRVSFSVTPRDLSTSNKPITNPNLVIDIGVKGKRNSENDVPESISSSATRNIKIASNIALGGRVLRSEGPFENTGPIPPKAEEQTTYTIIWNVDNTSSTVTNAEVRASLPPYVKWLGKIDPSNEDLKYNNVNGQLVWKIGNLETFTQNSARRKQVAFQVSINPSVTQVGQTLELVNQSTLYAQDDFTGQSLRSTLAPMTTRFSSDQSFRDGDEKVVR